MWLRSIGLFVLLAAVATFALWRARTPEAAAKPVLTVLQALGPGPRDDGFARATGPREFRFPADHGPHPEFRNEWWYWTGNLAAPDGRPFGFELTLFRTALAPDQDPERSSAWAPREVYMAHFTVSDIAERRFHAFERTSRGALDLAGATTSPLRLWVLDWSAIGAVEGAAPFPLHLVARDGDVALDLVLGQGKPIILQGDRGHSKKGPEPDNASYYYSLTRMPTSGSITLGGRRFDVRGESWMDREWSTRVLSPDQVGWNWFALRFDDGREMMLFHLRRRDGKKDPWTSGTIVDRDGTPHRLAADDVTVEPLGVWTSPHSHIAYPSGFRLTVSGDRLDVRVTPLMADQELALTFRYWEGAVRVAGEAGGKPTSGLGYLELTGYGEEGTRPP